MNFKQIFVFAFVCLAASCGKDKEEAPAGPSGPAPSRDFKSITGISAGTEKENVCPYVELAGFYKVGSSDCTNDGKKAPVDYELMPTRYLISKMTDSSGSIEIQFTRDGQEVLPEALDFPRIQNAASGKKLGVQCLDDSATGTQTLFRACNGGSVNGSCFYSVVKKDNRLTAVMSRVINGVQYWCRSNLRKVETEDQD